MPASLDVKPMRSCPKLSNNTPEMLVAAILDVRLEAVSHFDVPVHMKQYSSQKVPMQSIMLQKSVAAMLPFASYMTSL